MNTLPRHRSTGSRLAATVLVGMVAMGIGPLIDQAAAHANPPSDAVAVTGASEPIDAVDGAPAAAGGSAAAGKPDDVGNPKDAAKNDNRPADAGRPDSPGRSESAGRPESPGRSEQAGRQGAAGPVTATAIAGRRDAIRDEQWQLQTLDMEAAWRHSAGDGVVVAVIDSGVDANHPDLAGQVLAGKDLVTGTGDGRTDPVGHGTTVAGIIAGRGDDRNGVVGLAPKAKILPIRVLDDENRYDDAMIVAAAVRLAVDSGARVINLSLGGNGSSAPLAAALDYAFARDVVVVACTGNLSSSGPTDVWYPAREPGVLAVTGLDKEGQSLWSGAITGEQTVVSAPATGLVGARPGGYWRVQGTSFAAPMVSATAALIRARWPQMTAADVVNRLVRTARDVGPLGRDNRYGYGMVDPAAALISDVPSVPRNPLDNAPPPGVAGFGAAPDADEKPQSPAVIRGPVGARASGANAGWGAQPSEPVPVPASNRGWVGATLLFVLAGIGSFAVLRRVGR